MSGTNIVQRNETRRCGFALVEILIALSILSIILLSVFSGVSSSVYVMNGNRYATQAVLIARSKMNDYILREMRGTDLKDERIKEYPGYTFTRATKRYSFIGSLPANITHVTVHWIERGKRRSYRISYVWASK